jgi:hypothetical protein
MLILYIITTMRLSHLVTGVRKRQKSIQLLAIYQYRINGKFLFINISNNNNNNKFIATSQVFASNFKIINTIL